MSATNNFLRPQECLLLINTTGGTGNGKSVLRMNEVELTYENEHEELSTFDNGFNKIKRKTYSNWNISASGILSDDGSSNDEGEYAGLATGDTKMVGVIDGLQLLEQAKSDDTTEYPIILRFADDNYQSGAAIITSVSISSSEGTYSYSIDFSGSGVLTKLSS